MTNLALDFNFFLIFFTFFCARITSETLDPQEIKCNDLRKAFATATANFTLCSVENSKPITLCEKCISYYLNVVDSYQNMSKNFQNGTKCIDHFINQDRLGIVNTLYSDSCNLWNRAKCAECYVIQNGTHTHEKSKATVQFNKYYKDLYSCTDLYKDDILCLNCYENYTALSEFYASISNVNEKIGVCMDLVDLMNGTWKFWSEKCCGYRKHDEYIFIVSTVFVLLIAIIFYIVAQCYSERHPPTIIRPKRLAESITNFDIQNCDVVSN